MKRLMYIILSMFLLILYSVSATQYARPDQDLNLTASTWQNFPYFSKIDEVIQDNTDHIGSALNGGSLNVSLSSISDPQLSSGHTMRIAIRKFPTGLIAQTIDFSGSLFQGYSKIASMSEADIDTTYHIVTYTLTSGEADSITDYSNLTMQFKFTGDILIPERRGNVSWFEFETPDAPIINRALFIRGENKMTIRGDGRLRIRKS